MRKFKFYLFVLTIIFFFYIFVIKPVQIQKVSLGLEDIKYSLRDLLGKSPSPNPDVVVVAVDEKSINAYGRWPWDRKITGDLIHQLKDAKLVGLDIVFSEYTNKKSDRYLADSIKYAGNVISGFFFRTKATQTPTDKIIDYLENCSLKRYKLLSLDIGLKEFPYVESNIPEILESSLSCAFFNIEPDVDGIYRHYPIAYLFEGMIFPSLAVQMYRYYLNKEPYLEISSSGIVKTKIRNTVVKGSYINLNFYKDIKTISAYDILQGNFNKNQIKDKLVFVGVTEMGVYDVRPTPIDPIIPGVYLHATALSNLIDNNFLRTNYFYDVLIFLLLLITAYIVSFLKYSNIRYSLYLIVLLSPFFISSYLFIYKNLWISFSYAFMSLFIFILGVEIYQYFAVEKRSREIKKAFSKYVSPKIVEKIAKNPDKLELKGEEKEITVLFSDIRNFTTITENLNPQQVAKLLNIYLEKMSEIVLKNEGLLDKYIGDAVMALYNAVIYQENHADLACRTALEMRKQLKDLNKQLKKEKLPEINIGIGINTGLAVVGNLGSSFRFEYTAVGDAINLASRLEGLNRFYKTNIIVSQFTKEKTKENFLFRLLDKVKVKGKKEAIFIYELMENTKENKAIKEKYEKAFNFYLKKEFKKAKVIFEDMWENYNDFPSYIMIQRIEILEKNIPENWDGSYEFKEK